MHFSFIAFTFIFLSCYAYSDIRWDSWMEDNFQFLENRTLFEVMIPGTHDSGSFELTSEICPSGSEEIARWKNIASAVGINVVKIIQYWGKSQSISILEQLNQGIRHLDLRAMWKDNSWYTHHALIGIKIETILDEIVSFMNSKSSEILILEVGHTDVSASGYDNNDLLQLIETKLNTWLVPKNTNLKTLTFGQMRKTNKRIICNFDNAYSAADFSLIYYIHDMMNGRYANTDDIHTMNNHNQLLFSEKNDYQIMEMSWTLTPSTKVIMDGIAVWNPQNLLQLAAKANQYFNDFYNFNKNQFAGIIIASDNFQTGSFRENCVNFIQTLGHKSL
ncbi:hypothetical protein WA158_001179 [Blastocystis sp. Blastoise]